MAVAAPTGTVVVPARIDTGPDPAAPPPVGAGPVPAAGAAAPAGAVETGTAGVADTGEAGVTVDVALGEVAAGP